MLWSQAYAPSARGVGRRLSRTKARQTLSVASLREAMAGRSWNSDSAEKLLDEHPASYKDIDHVMQTRKTLRRSRPYAPAMATVLTVRDRLKRQINDLELMRKKAATLNDISCSAALQAAGELGARAVNVPVRVVRPEHEDVVVVGLSVKAGGYDKHTIIVPTVPMTNDQYADYLEFRELLGPAEASVAVTEG